MKHQDLNIYCGAYYGDGWDQLVDPLVELCKKYNVQIAQIKEKFGTLRFYVDNAPDEVLQAIEKAENASASICETCGKPGKLRINGGWWSTRCEGHCLR